MGGDTVENIIQAIREWLNDAGGPGQRSPTTETQP
jgi:hypothetical protein